METSVVKEKTEELNISPLDGKHNGVKVRDPLTKKQIVDSGLSTMDHLAQSLSG